MKITLSFIISLSTLVTSVLAASNLDIEPEYQKVTCGSAIKLAHEKSAVRLHSHAIPYGSGSGQQSITGVKAADDTNSLWTVMAQLDTTCDRGEPVPCGTVIRLKHVNTKKYLHSHLHKSPMSLGQEVSGYEGADGGDNWTVECSTGFWLRESPINLIHTDTGAILSTSTQHVYGNPIPGQQEVSAHKSAAYRAVDQRWIAQEGIYFADKNAL